MIVSINQPAYLPWLGYYHRIALSDIHIVLDHVQFEKNSFTNRNKIRTKEGWCWASIPLKTKGKFGDLSIERVEIADDQRWRKKHWAAIQQNYSKAPYFSDHSGFFEDVYKKDWTQLKDILRETNNYLLNAFGIKTRIQYSSEMGIEGQKDELVLNLCRALNATTYISGALGRDYIDKALFDDNNIKLLYQDYDHPAYPQAFPGFESYMAAIDLLFNCGPESLGIIMKDQEEIR